MRKFIIPIINLVNLILVSIAFGLGGNTALYSPVGTEKTSLGNYYQIVWNNPTAIGVVAFFFFIFAVALSLATLIPFKYRKYCTCVNGLMYIVAGVLTLQIGNQIASPKLGYSYSGSLIAFTVLLFIAGSFAIVMSLIEFLSKPEEK